MLRQRLQVFNMEGEFLLHEAINADLVRLCVEVRYRTMIAVIPAFFCNETRVSSATFVLCEIALMDSVP